MSDVFLSYSSKDREQALALAHRLQSAGFDVWIDKNAIHGATNWSTEIVRALDECRLVILLISEASMASKNCAKEVTIAAEADKRILPVELQHIQYPEAFRYHLAGIQRVSFADTEAIVRSIERFGLSGSGSQLSPPSDGSHMQRFDAIRLAVLPFDDLSPQKDNEWFADGMLDELIGTLSSIERIRVAGRSDVVYYRKHRPKSTKIAEDLRVRYLVEGSVRKAGDRIRISASLTDVAVKHQLWSQHFDGTFENVFDFQEDVAKQITAALKLTLTPQEAEIIAERPTENIQAYELYLKGGEFHRLTTQEGYEHALKLYEAAVAIDHSYVDAYVAIASVCAVYYRECSRDPQWLNRAEMNLQKAEALAGSTARILWVKGEIYWQRDRFDDAITVLKQATTLAPNDTRCFNMLGNVYLRSGKIDDAIDAFAEVLRLEESQPAYFNLLIALAVKQDFEQLAEIAKRAIPVIEGRVTLFPDDLNARITLAQTLAWAGEAILAEEQAEIASEDAALGGTGAFNLAAVFESLGKPKRSIELYRIAIERGFHEVEAFSTEASDPSIREEYSALLDDLRRKIAYEQQSR